MAKRPIPLNVMEREQVKVLRASGLTYHAISKELGRDPKTIKKACLDPEMAPQIEQVKVALADRFESIAVRMLTDITDRAIKKTNPYQRVLSAAIATDKLRLLRDQSTENLNILQIIERIERDGMSQKPPPEVESDGQPRKEQEGAVLEKAIPPSRNA